MTAIEKHQMQELKLSSDRVSAVILLDNAPAHPHTDELVALGGRVRALFLPPNTTSVIQPMDQGVIQATKMRYKRLFLKDVLVVHDEAEDEESDNRGLKTLENLKAYNLKSAIYNLSASWKAITQSTLLNAWNPLLHDKDDDMAILRVSKLRILRQSWRMVVNLGHQLVMLKSGWGRMREIQGTKSYQHER